MIKIVVCLGNPGTQYRRNRHNVGFITGDYIQGAMGSPSRKKQGNAEICKGTIFGKEIMLLYPQTYMNNSGRVVVEYLRYTKATLDELLVLHDELELSFGTVALKTGGGHKGHNGIRSIMTETGGADFHRIRLGIGRPPGQMGVADFVLSDFSKEEQTKLEDMAVQAMTLLENILVGKK